MKTITVSNKHIKMPVYSVRTKAQRDVVEKITKRLDFDFACGNPFEKEVKDYVGTFYFIWYTKNGEIHLVRISPAGRITKEING